MSRRLTTMCIFAWLGVVLLGVSSVHAADAGTRTSSRTQVPRHPVQHRPQKAPDAPAQFPCGRPLVVRYNGEGAPVGIEPALRRAGAALGAALHRTVRYRRSTAARSLHDVAGRRVQTILVRWVATTRELAASGPSDTIATGTTVRSGRRLLAGEVVLAADAPPPPDRVEIVLRHELAHAVGVEHHSADPRDLLFFRLDRAKAPIWGPGDQAALAAVGCRSH